MDLTIYKIFHMVGIQVLFLAFGGLLLGSWLASGREFAHRRLFVILHGVGLLLILVSGFGQLARLGIHNFPPWVAAKVGIWVLLGLVLSVVFRKPSLGKITMALIFLAGASAAYIAVFKPF